MPAATRAPNATTRTTIVTGSESRPARSRSLPTVSSISLLALSSRRTHRSKRSGCGGLRLVDGRDDRVDLVRRVCRDRRECRTEIAAWPSAEICSALADRAGCGGRDDAARRDAARRRPRWPPRTPGSSRSACRSARARSRPAGCWKPLSRILAIRPGLAGRVVLGAASCRPRRRARRRDARRRATRRWRSSSARRSSARRGLRDSTHWGSLRSFSP